MSKLLSVSIAAYNVEDTIKQCLDSFLTSRYFDELELLVVNDGSHDQTVEIVKKYEKKYPHVIHLVNKENGGHGSTINTSLKIATGKFYKILDGDDWVDVTELDKLMECLYRTHADLIINDYQEVFPDYDFTKRISHRKNYKIGKVYHFDDLKNSEFFGKDIFAMHETTILTQKLRDVQMKIQEHCFYVDTEFVYYVGLVAETIEFNDSCVYQYRKGISGQSVSAEGSYKHIEDFIKVELNLMHLYQQDAKQISSSVRRAYLFSIIDTRYTILFRNFTKVIQRDNKDKLFFAFLKKAKDNYPEQVSQMHLSVFYQLTSRYPQIMIKAMRKFRMTYFFRVMRHMKHKVQGTPEI